MRDHSLYLSDILKAFKAIESFVEGQSFEDFKKRRQNLKCRD